MDIDLALAIAHHLAIFSLVAVLAAEIATVRPGLTGDALFRLAQLDRFYGAAAAIVVIVGFLRVFFGAASAVTYLANPVFWMKIGAFALVGLLSIAPTLAFMRWNKAGKENAAFTPSADAIAKTRKFFAAQVSLLIFIPAFAAAMARGYGL